MTFACAVLTAATWAAPGRGAMSMRKGQWMRYNHSAAGYNNDHAFRFTSPWWVFGSDGPLAAWCQQYPQGGDERGADVYQFGVYTGGTMAGQVIYFRLLGIKFGNHWGFDSFVGLPPEAAGVKIMTKNWLPGAYSAADALRTWSWPRLAAGLHKRINRSKAEGRVELVRGFYNETLTPSLAKERGMQPAMYVDVDADLYLSAMQCMQWLFCSGLVRAGAMTGTVFRHDDWGGPTNAAELVGENRAHREITVQHKVTWSFAGLLSNWFRVTSYELDTAYCSARGYAPVSPTLGNDRDASDAAGASSPLRFPPQEPTPAEKAAAERAAAAGAARQADSTATAPAALTSSHIAVRACLTRVKMWTRPFTGLDGMRLRCSDGYLRKLTRTYEWALRYPPARTPAMVQHDHAAARLKVCDMLHTWKKYGKGRKVRAAHNTPPTPSGVAP